MKTRGRPKTLPRGTVEWLRLSQNNDVFHHPSDTMEKEVHFDNALSPSFFRVGVDALNPHSKCKFQITFLYQPATAYTNSLLGSLALNTESHLEPLPQTKAKAKQDSLPQIETEPEPEYSQMMQNSQEADTCMNEVGRTNREEVELLETDEDEDEYGMTDKAEKEFFGLVVEAEKIGVLVGQAIC